MWGVFRHIPCSRVCYTLFEKEEQAQLCANNFCEDNWSNDYYVLYTDSLKDLARYIVFGVKP